MFFYRYATYVLIAVSLVFSGCATLSPVHHAKFIFAGTVKDEAGKPIPNAWVKVRGWETLTGSDGKWRQEQVVDCGALRDHPANYEENDAVLVTADGFASAEESFIVKHPGYFQSCQADQTVLFETVLEKVKPKHAVKPKAKESDEPPSEQQQPSKKGRVSL